MDKKERSFIHEAVIDLRKSKKKEILEEVNDDLQACIGLARKTGVKGEFTCPSCMNRKPRESGVFEDGGFLMICQDCFITWIDLFMDGKIHKFTDLIPQSREC